MLKEQGLWKQDIKGGAWVLRWEQKVFILEIAFSRTGPAPHHVAHWSDLGINLFTLFRTTDKLWVW